VISLVLGIVLIECAVLSVFHSEVLVKFLFSRAGAFLIFGFSHSPVHPVARRAQRFGLPPARSRAFRFRCLFYISCSASFVTLSRSKGCFDFLAAESQCAKSRSNFTACFFVLPREVPLRPFDVFAV
jgi:hypothetical protein